MRAALRGIMSIPRTSWKVLSTLSRSGSTIPSPCSKWQSTTVHPKGCTRCGASLTLRTRSFLTTPAADSLSRSSCRGPTGGNGWSLRNRGVVRSDMEVTQVQYYAPSSLEVALRDVLLGFPRDWRGCLRTNRKRIGFGEVELAYYAR